jgi:hypothetical protein
VTATWHIAIPPTVPLYWRAAPATVGGLLVGGLVHDQHRVAAAAGLCSGQVPGRPVRGGVQHQLLIEAGAGQQVLHPVRSRMAGGLGHRPAVVIVQFGQQAVHHVAAGETGLPPGEARRDPRQQVLEQPGVPFVVYRGTSGCRLIVLFHKLA